MPELPEVETIRRQLREKIVGKKLDGKKIVDVRRRAKILIIDFSDGSSLVFNDIRKFGWWKYVKNSKDIEKAFGPEALEVNSGGFKNILEKRPNAKIKPLLMDQKFIAGIGNIYSDEILFAAKVQPLRRIKTLKPEEIRAVWSNIKKILKEAIKKRGTSERDYIDALGKKGDYLKYLKVYRKEGQKCPRCGGVVKRVKIGSRSAHFCPKCQR